MIEWPENEIIERTDIRKKYIAALQSADNLDYKPLIHLHKTLINS